MVTAEIEVATVIVKGGIVHGNIRARTSIELYAPGRVVGNLHSPSLFVERGVVFQGNCRMDGSDSSEGGQVDAERGLTAPRELEGGREAPQSSMSVKSSGPKP